MNLSLFLLGLVGFALGLLVVRLLMRMADQRDAATRYKDKRIIPFPEENLTRWGHH